MTEIVDFFRSHLDELNGFLNRYPSDPNDRKPNQFDPRIEVAEFFRSVIDRPGIYDDCCRTTIFHIGEQFLAHLSAVPPNYKFLLMFAARCAKEFMIRSNITPPHYFYNIILYFDQGAKNNNELREEAVYLQHGHVAEVIREIVNERTGVAASVAAELEKQVKETDGKISGWRQFCKEQAEFLENQREYIDKLQEDFNFVGLSKAFSDALKEKNREKWWLFSGLLILGALLIIPLGYLSVFRPFTPFKIEDAPAYLPIVGIEVLMFYFFRVMLLNYQSVKGQILQLRLRKSLCAFIQGYTEFSSANKNANLERFEAQIFSGLTPDPNNIPSTFDGFEQLVKLVKAAKEGR